MTELEGQVVGDRPDDHPLLLVCLERELPQELVRGQAGVVGAEGARVIYEQSLSLCLHGRIR